MPPCALSMRPFRCCVGSGKGPFLVPEQFALEQRLWNRSAVDGDEGLALSRALTVDRSRHQFLPRTAFAGNQHRHIGRPDTANHAKHVLHLRTVPHQPFKFILAGLLLKYAIFLLKVGKIGRALEHNLEHVKLNRLFDKVVGAAFNRGDGLRCDRYCP